MAPPEVGELGFVNHAPTLFRNNRGAKTAGIVECGDKIFVDPRHKTLAVPFEIQTILDTLFGTDPEQCYINHRMFLLLQTLHSTDFLRVVLDKFPRFTYDLESTALLEADLGGSTVDPQLNPGESSVQTTVIGNSIPDHQKGRLLQGWIVEATTGVLWGDGEYPSAWGGGVALKATNILDGVIKVTPLDATSIELPVTAPADRLLVLKFTTTTVGVPLGTYNVNVLARPTENLPEIEARLRGLSEDVVSALFTNEEEIDLGRRLWEQHHNIAFRMSGFLIALIFRLEGIRQRGELIVDAIQA